MHQVHAFSAPIINVWMLRTCLQGKAGSRGRRGGPSPSQLSKLSKQYAERAAAGLMDVLSNSCTNHQQQQQQQAQQGVPAQGGSVSPQVLHPPLMAEGFHEVRRILVCYTWSRCA